MSRIDRIARNSKRPTPVVGFFRALYQDMAASTDARNRLLKLAVGRSAPTGRRGLNAN